MSMICSPTGGLSVPVKQQNNHNYAAVNANRPALHAAAAAAAGVRTPARRQHHRSTTVAAAGATAPSSAADVGAALRFLGKGPLCMPRLGLGLAALGRPGYINLGHNDDLSRGKDVDSMREQCWKVLDDAWAVGIRYFDAARSYGRAEEFLGGWIEARSIPTDAVVIGSKWGYTYTANWEVDTQGQPHEVKEHSAANLIRQAAETDSNLGRHLDLYQIHSATLDSGVLSNADVLKALEEVKTARGWALGLSVSGAQQGKVIQQAMQARMTDGSLLFDSVQATWNLLEQSAGDDLVAAHQAGMSIIIKEAMANGRLTSRNADPAFAGKLRLLQDTAKQYDTTVDALALACVLNEPFYPMVLSGATTAEQLHSNFAAVELANEVPNEVLQMLMTELVQDPQDYWQQRSQLAWN